MRGASPLPGPLHPSGCAPGHPRPLPAALARAWRGDQPRGVARPCAALRPASGRGEGAGGAPREGRGAGGGGSEGHGGGGGVGAPREPAAASGTLRPGSRRAPASRSPPLCAPPLRLFGARPGGLGNPAAGGPVRAPRGLPGPLSSPPAPHCVRGGVPGAKGLAGAGSWARTPAGSRRVNAQRFLWEAAASCPPLLVPGVVASLVLIPLLAFSCVISN